MMIRCTVLSLKPLALVALVAGLLSTQVVVQSWTMIPGRSCCIRSSGLQKQTLMVPKMMQIHDSMDDFDDDEYSDFADYQSSSSSSNDDTSDDFQDSTRDDDEDDDEDDDTTKTRTTMTSKQEEKQPQQVRASIAGVSVERNSGFWIVLRISNDQYWPLQVTDHVTDRMAATSGQALTLVQLLSRVDMAGVILPPQILAQLLIVSLEEEESNADNNNNAQQQQSLLHSIHKQIQALLSSTSSPAVPPREEEETAEEEDEEEEFSYTDANMWIRSRIKLPVCTLDQVHLDLSSSSSSPTSDTEIDFDVVVRDSLRNNAQKPDRWTLKLQESATAPVLLQDYRPTVSRHFLAVALSLRYRAPILVTLPAAPAAAAAAANKYPCSLETLMQEFPLYRSVDKLQQSSDRVVQTIERGFEIHQMQAAFNIARQKQDFAATAKIQAKIDELDRASLSQIPVQPESDMDAMQ